MEFAYRRAVKQIELNGSRATGVLLEDGQRLEADAVLANADLPYVYQELLPPDRRGQAAGPQALLVLGDQLLLGGGPALSGAWPAHPLPGG